MVVMVRDTSLDALERDRVLSPDTQKRHQQQQQQEGRNRRERDALGMRAVEQPPVEGHEHASLSNRQDGYSGTTVHHYVEPMVSRDETRYETAVSHVESNAKDCDGEVSLTLKDTSDSTACDRKTSSNDGKVLTRQEKEAREVEDVIRRHAIRQYREGVEAGAAGSVSSSSGTLLKGNEDVAREDDVNETRGSSMYTTPKKKKSINHANICSSGNSSMKKKKKKKGTKKHGKKKRFGIFGNLFSSESPEQKMSFTGEGSERGFMDFHRPPALVVDDARQPTKGPGGTSGCMSPLMVTSPGLSCGGLLDETFASAMRVAENTTGDERNEDDEVASSEVGNPGPDVDDGALLMALSPRTLLASPRVVRKFSNVSRPIQTIGRQQSSAAGERSQEEKEYKQSNEYDPLPQRGDERKIHIKAYEQEEEEPMVPLNVHEEELRNMRSLIQNLKAQHAMALREMAAKYENERNMTGAFGGEEEKQMPLSKHLEEMRNEKSLNTAFIKQLESEHNDKVQSLEKLMESTLQQQQAQEEDTKRHNKELEEEKRALKKRIEEIENQKSIMLEEASAPLKTRCMELETAKDGLEMRVRDLEAKNAEIEGVAADMKQRCMELEESKDSLQQQVENVQEQKMLAEETSLALANQVAALQTRLQASEKMAQDAQQQLRIQDATMKTRISTMESLNSDIQRLTRENTRLFGDKSNMEEHVRRLTSILHTVMARTMTVPDDDSMQHLAKMIQEAPDKVSRHSVTVAGTDNQATPGMPPVPCTKEPLMPSNGRHEKTYDSIGKDKDAITLKAPIASMTPQEAREYKNTRTTELDKQLLELNLEREKLDLEMSRMPVHSGGKTVAQRRRKKQIEYRLDEVLKDIGKVKRELRVLAQARA